MVTAEKTQVGFGTFRSENRLFSKENKKESASFDADSLSNPNTKDAGLLSHLTAFFCATFKTKKALSSLCSDYLWFLL